MASTSCPTPTRRLLYLPDRASHSKFLVDTGAEVSILPPRPQDRNHPQGRELQAANGAPIACYGERPAEPRFHLGGNTKPFPWRFLVADVAFPILGADFLSHYNLLVDLRRKRLITGDTGVATCVASIKTSSPAIRNLPATDCPSGSSSASSRP